MIRQSEISLAIVFSILLMGTHLVVYSQPADSTIIKHDSDMREMAQGLFKSNNNRESPPAFVSNLCLEAIKLYDLPQNADTLLVLCDTYNLIGTGDRYVDICTEIGGNASYVKGQFDTHLQEYPIRREWARTRLDFLLGKIRLGVFEYFSDDSNYINNFTDHWSMLYFLFFVRINGEYLLCFYQKMGQDIKEVYLGELAERER